MGYNYFFVYGKELEEVAWGESYRKISSSDGYAVSTYIEERGEGERDVLHVVNDMEYALDLGDGESWSCTRYIDIERGELVMSAELVGISEEGIALLRELSKETK